MPMCCGTYAGVLCCATQRSLSSLLGDQCFFRVVLIARPAIRHKSLMLVNILRLMTACGNKFLNLYYRLIKNILNRTYLFQPAVGNNADFIREFTCLGKIVSNIEGR